MGKREVGEPPYPANEEELQQYCKGIVNTLVSNLGNQLICVLLNGSWAREEARPPHSDVDITIIIDQMDEFASNALVLSWQESEIGRCNVIDLIELQAKPREMIAMLCDEVKLLYGHYPFQPDRTDYANNIVDTASRIGLYARTVEYYHWEAVERKIRDIKYIITSKYDLIWLLKNLVAYRSGVFPKNSIELKEKIQHYSEFELFQWIDHFTDEDYREKHLQIARCLSLYVHQWLKEVVK